VGDTPAMDNPDYPDHTARVLDGEAQFIGGLFWPRLEPPLLKERFSLLATTLPPGTIAAGITAGWAWSGMGSPTPLGLIAKTQPAPSPLARHAWKIRGIALQPHQLDIRDGVSCLNKQATVSDLLTCDGADDVVAAQLFWLLRDQPLPTPVDNEEGCTTRRLSLVRAWQVAYPWATR
jgi:hypothetical protein